MRAKRVAKQRREEREYRFAAKYNYPSRHFTRGAYKHHTVLGVLFLGLPRELQDKILEWMIIFDIENEDVICYDEDERRPTYLRTLEAFRPFPILYNQALAMFYKQGYPLYVDADDWVDVKKLPEHVCVMVTQIKAYGR